MIILLKENDEEKEHLLYFVFIYIKMHTKTFIQLICIQNIHTSSSNKKTHWHFIYYFLHFENPICFCRSP